MYDLGSETLANSDNIRRDTAESTPPDIAMVTVSVQRLSHDKESFLTCITSVKEKIVHCR